ncbi:MAG: SsrA-binding protein SmpB [Candidatus Bipolaricaulis sp.]|nr:SsrA-binding protein SmpB [Candidatus Bipolaricaulis sp.]
MSTAVATNRKARHEYSIEDTIEAGLVLTGPEVKSLRAGRCSLQEGYAVVRDGEAILKGVHISPYKEGSFANLDAVRDRRLLLHRHELRRLAMKLDQRGYTLVPLKLYFERGFAKIELGLARGRTKGDKRQKLRDDAVKRDAEEAMKRFSRGERV